MSGPCSGKSTTAAWLFSELKIRDISIELVTEFVKSWASVRRNINKFDQIYLFAKQLQYEYRFLSADVKNIVTDSPLILSCIYSDFYYPELKLGEKLLPIIKEYESVYPSVNIYLNRSDKKYNTDGRYQTYLQAVEIDNLVKDFMQKHLTNTYYVNYNDRKEILEIAIKHCNII